MNYRTGNHNPALVYGERDDAEFFAPPPAAELVAVFVREHEADALHYARAMNATMPTCTCRVICYCGALVGSTSGCETCEEHNGECVGADLGELLDNLITYSSGDLPARAADDTRAEILRRFGWLGRYAPPPREQHVNVAQFTENGTQITDRCSCGNSVPCPERFK